MIRHQWQEHPPRRPVRRQFRLLAVARTRALEVLARLKALRQVVP